MKCTIKWDEDSKTINVPEEEGCLWEEVGKILPTIDIPNQIQVNTPYGDASLRVGARGSYIKDNVKRPSMYVTTNYNNIQGLAASAYQERYLTCINPESNNYKFYHLKPGPSGINVTYGRIGSERGDAFGVKDIGTPYEPYLFYVRYYEKLSKGYVDQTNIYLNNENEEKSCENEFSERKVETGTSKINKASVELYNLLRRLAHKYVESQCISATVSIGQLREAEVLFEKIGESADTIDDFNAALLKLMAVSPRKCRYVTELLANKMSDIPDIVEREENLLNAMRALVSPDSVKKREVSVTDHFREDGIEVYIANDKQRDKVLSSLDLSLRGKVKEVYRVINNTHKKRFNNYLKEHDIRKVKELWHGSRNENWLSIVNNGLLLNPNAIITGKMFGRGIYFAPSSFKSWGYTSYKGTHWAKGTSTTGIMGVYATAYGKPLDTSSAYQYTAAELTRRGLNCVHAHAGAQLKNDEIIFYDEAAMLLNYIVIFN